MSCDALNTIFSQNIDGNFSDRNFLAENEQTISYAELERTVSFYRNVITEKNIEFETVLLSGNFNLESIAWLLALADSKNIIILALDASSIDDQNLRGKIAKAHWKISKDTYWQPVPFLLDDDDKMTPALYDAVRAQNHAGLVLFSSGSTGVPKAMLHDLTNLFGKYENRKPKNLPILAALLFDHIGGLNTLFGALASRQFLVAPESRQPEIIARLIEQYKVAVLPTSPTFLNLLLLSGVIDKYDLTSLRVISYGTEPMPPALLVRAKEKFPRVKFIETFGTSETGIVKTKSGTDNMIKLADPDMEYKVVDDELWLRSKTQIIGYLNADMSRFTADGWFRTGDRVEMTPEGLLRILGRENDWINIGGEKVFPSEVESVILEVPFIAECRVIGASNPLTGQSVLAEIVLNKNTDLPEDIDIIKRDIRRHCRGKLASYKVPTRVVIVENLPISERGKRVRR